MTAHEVLPRRTVSAPAHSSLPVWRRALLFGSGLGVAIGARDLELAIAQTRPSGAKLSGETTIADFRSRPAAEWGAEILRFLSARGETRIAATVLLPRDEVIVRTLSLPGVSDKDVPAAIELQIETLHPWRDEDVAWGWVRAGEGTVLAGIARRSLLDSYETLFSEAGLPLGAITFSPAAIYASLRMWNPAPGPVLCFAGEDRIEVYGESESRAVYSAGFSIDRARALEISRSELRLSSDFAAQALEDVLPQPAGTVSVSGPLAWAAALANSARRGIRFANLLPPERRASRSTLQYLLPAVLGCLLVAALVIAFVVFPAIEESRYRDDLKRATRSVEPAALRVQNLEKRIAADQARVAALDDFRRRPQADLDVLNELTRLLPPPVWTSAVEIYPDAVVISGEADQAAPLLKIIDSSPLFQNSEFAASVTRNKDSELFRIRTLRRGRTGRTTP